MSTENCWVWKTSHSWGQRCSWGAGGLVEENTSFSFNTPKKTTQQVGCGKEKSKLEIFWPKAQPSRLMETLTTWTLEFCPPALCLPRVGYMTRKWQCDRKTKPQSSDEDSKYTFNINFLLFISHLIPCWLEDLHFFLHNFYLNYTFIHCCSCGLKVYHFNNNIFCSKVHLVFREFLERGFLLASFIFNHRNLHTRLTHWSKYGCGIKAS